MTPPMTTTFHTALHVTINGTAHMLAPGATLADAIHHIQAVPPFAAAVNQTFVPRSAHAAHGLQPHDQIEVIRPVTGG